MITLSEADKIIAEAIQPYPAVRSDLKDSYGLVLRQDILADRDLPPFNKSLMDGIAIDLKAYQKGVRKFPIEGVQSAGKPRMTLSFDHSCFEIMTGAVLPEGCNCVIPVEQIRVEDGKALVNDDLDLMEMQCIRPQGADHTTGKVLVKKGIPLDPVQIATAAAVGLSQIKVSPKLIVALVSNGDELVDIDAPIESYQIRKSNSYFMQAALDKTQLFNSTLYHFRDDLKVLRTQIQAILQQYDVVVLTGGVSMGKFDLIPQVLKELNVEVLFHKVEQKPGKPFWFGRTTEGKPVFALPGNPVSTQVGMYRHVIPSLKKALGISAEPEQIKLSEAYTPSTKFTYFCPVRLTKNAAHQWLAQPVATGGSGDFATLAETDGFVELPGGVTTDTETWVDLYKW